MSSYRYRSQRQGVGGLRKKLVALTGEKPRFPEQKAGLHGTPDA
ncbi:MAG: hypothetical protein WB819_04805 [Terriglobia bacterium]